jgi:hypothetical protein
MQTKTLFSPHFLDTRLETMPEWQDDPHGVFEEIRALWQKARKFGDKWNEAQTEDEFVKPVLAVLGWEFIVLPKNTAGG